MAEQRHRLNWKTVLTGLFAVAVTLFAFYMLHRFTEDITLSDVFSDIGATPVNHLLLAVLATGVGFAAIAFYENVSVQLVTPGRISRVTASWVGISSFAISNVAGFHILTGGALGYRIYSSKGLEIPEIGQIVAYSWLTFWLGLTLLLALAFTFDPGDLLILSAVPESVIAGSGIVVLALFVLYLAWSATAARSVALYGVTIRTPGPAASLLLLLSGALDVASAVMVLYVLMPADVVGSLGGFYVICLSAIIIGAASHSPGGLGVFEAVVIAGLGATGRSDVIGALVLYRIIYFFLPLLPVALILFVNEVGKNRSALQRAGKNIGKFSEPLVPPLVAGLASAGGLILLLSGSIPSGDLGHEWIRSVLPLPFVESSHLLASLIGLILLVLANALLRRRERAYFLTMILLGAGSVFALTRGLDYEEAAFLLTIFVLLLPFRSAFYRKSSEPLLTVTPGWLAIIMITVGAAVWLGFFAHRHVEYSNQLWWEFTWDGSAPRFLRTSVAVVAAVFALGLNMILTRRGSQNAPADPIPDSVRRLVAESTDPDSTIALLGDKHFLVSDDEKAFLMYGVMGGSFISMGDPVGDPEQAEALAWRFREMADQGGYRTVFYSVGPKMLPLYLDMGLSVLKIGEKASVDMQAFTLDLPVHKSMRRACRKAEKDGMSFSIIPQADVPDILGELKEVSDAWLATKSGSEKQFAIASFREDYLKCFDCAVVKLDGRIVAFANILRGAEKEELSIDLMRYRPKISSVMMDYLFAQLLLQGKEEGYKWFALGAAPLAGLTDHPLATSWNRIGTLIYRHGEEFYHFEGLRSYKAKFDPIWTPNYLACPGGFSVPKVLFDVTALIAGGRSKAITK